MILLIGANTTLDRVSKYNKDKLSYLHIFENYVTDLMLDNPQLYLKYLSENIRNVYDLDNNKDLLYVVNCVDVLNSYKDTEKYPVHDINYLLATLNDLATRGHRIVTTCKPTTFIGDKLAGIGAEPINSIAVLVESISENGLSEEHKPFEDGDVNSFDVVGTYL